MYYSHLFDESALQRLVDPTTTIFWFRRDLRIEDNAGLFHALKENNRIVPVFIFDSNILNRLDKPGDRRITFIHHTLLTLNAQLNKLGSSLLVLHGDPLAIFKNLHPGAVYTNRDYEPYARKRDQAVQKVLEQKGIRFKSFKDQVIFEQNEIMKDDGTPYTVFTPFSKKWKQELGPEQYGSYDNAQYFNNFCKIPPLSIPSIKDIGFEESLTDIPPPVIAESVIRNYQLQRDFPSIRGTTRLSVHLRFGTISIRKLVQAALGKSEAFLNELIWREFYQCILWHFPRVETHSFKSHFDRIEWLNQEEHFNAWCDGRTGYPIVDAGMRELNATGFMHNRVRMIVASFLTKHLLIDWRWGESYFARQLLDFDLAANNGGWQWAAGSGCDAAPYFRIFNPSVQAIKFDPQGRYIRSWVPEVNTGDYPAPVVDHNMARQRALKTFEIVLVK